MSNDKHNDVDSITAAKAAMKRSDFAGAKAILENICSDKKSDLNVEAHYLLAVSLRYLGFAQDALPVLNRLMEIKPDYARAFQELGYCLGTLNKEAQSAKAFFDATSLNPALVGCWQQLVKVYQKLDERESELYAQTNLDYWQSLPRQLLGSAELLYDGKLTVADQVCRQFLRQHKHHPEGLFVLGLIGVQMGQYIDADFVFESCIALAPNHQRARYEYGMLLNRLGKYKQAAVQADYLLEIAPRNNNYHVLKGLVLAGLGDYEAGIEKFNQVLALEPQRASLWLQLGHALKSAGDIDAAISAYQNAYRCRPRFGDAYWSLVNTKTYALTEQELADVQKFITQPDMNDEDFVHLSFAAAKALEERQQYSQAFKHYERGNARQHQLNQYHPATTSHAVDQNIAFFDEKLFSSVNSVGCERNDPIFILGLPRAGSTLIEQILASHSAIDGTMELQNILALVARLSKSPNQSESSYPHMLRTLDKEYFQRFGQQFIDQTQQYRSGAPFFIDKMPNNFMHIGLIKLILPNAKVIDARREAMSCCFSGYKQLFAEGQAFSYDLNAIGTYYKDYVRMMAHWEKVLPGFVLRVNYEDVVADVETQVRRMLAFLGLPFEEACLSFYQSKRPVNTPSSQQVRQPIYTQGLKQWEYFSEYLGELKATLNYTD